jgi:uncharacterized tellurite resistance protein B-like protein
MLKAIQDFFREQMAADQSGRHDPHCLQLAAAALLFEMLRADQNEHPEEYAALQRVLQANFALSAEETQQLARLAEQEAAEAVSLYQFTGLINQHFSAEEKVQLVQMLWEVAYADGHLDRFEEALVRKIADLLHVPHRDFIQAKHRVQGALQ